MGDFITMSDEDGNKMILESYGTVEHNDKIYYAFGIPDSEENNEEVEVVFFENCDDGEEEFLTPVEDVDLLDDLLEILVFDMEEDEE